MEKAWPLRPCQSADKPQVFDLGFIVFVAYPDTSVFPEIGGFRSIAAAILRTR